MPTIKKTKSAKGASKKKTSRKRSIRKVAVVSLPEEAFWINGGPIVQSLSELKEVLMHISDLQFDYHVSKDKNDFAVWIASSLGNKLCAKKVKKAKTRTECIRVMEAFL